MPSLGNPPTSMASNMLDIPQTNYALTNVSTRNTSMRKNAAVLLQGQTRTAASKSVINRQVGHGQQGGTLLNRQADLNSSMSVNNQKGRYMTKSVSMASLGSNEDKLQRSQLNIDRKMREDFDRL